MAVLWGEFLIRLIYECVSELEKHISGSGSVVKK